MCYHYIRSNLHRIYAAALEVAFYWLEIVDEQEYDQYIRAISGFHPCDFDKDPLLEPLRDDEYGICVPGCYRVLPAPTH